MNLIGWKVGRVDVATYLGMFIWIVMLESHWLPRPIVFLLGPFLVLGCIYLLGPSLTADRWRSAFFLAVTISVLGFVLTRYVFVHPW